MADKPVSLPDQLRIEIGEGMRTSALAYRAADRSANATFVLAHGAGAGQQSAFITGFARGLADRGVDVLTFNFLYTEQRRRVPDRTEKLEACYRAAIATARDHFDRRSVYIGGKSMGGRIASMVADEAGVAGLVCLGYPFHPPGNPTRTRTKHLENLRTPALIIQGTRDTFGRPDEVAKYKLSKEIRIVWIEAGDHSLKPPARSGRTETQNIASAIEEAQGFIAKLKI